MRGLLSFSGNHARIIKVHLLIDRGGSVAEWFRALDL